MTVLEKRKYGLIRKIISDTNERRVSAIEKLYNNVESCNLSNEEIRNVVIQRRKDFEEGKIFLISQEQIKRKEI